MLPGEEGPPRRFGGDDPQMVTLRYEWDVFRGQFRGGRPLRFIHPPYAGIRMPAGHGLLMCRAEDCGWAYTVTIGMQEDAALGHWLLAHSSWGTGPAMAALTC